METQSSYPDYPPDDEIFHKSKFLRVMLGIGVVLQAAMSGFIVIFLMFGTSGYYGPHGVAVEICRILGIPYLLLILYTSTIWFLCFYYNRTLPRHKTFIWTELSRSVPLCLGVIGFFVLALPEMVREVMNQWQIGYTSDTSRAVAAILLFVILVVIAVIGVWSLFWMFVYFIRERREEICEAFGIGKRKELEVEAETINRNDEDEAARERRDADSEDAPLLIDHDQMV